jgi:predicted PurR-regulated permease PerM
VRGRAGETRLILPRIRWGWLLVALVTLLFFYSARAILGPFLAGFVIAYLLDPLTDRLERRGVARWLATTTVLALFLGAIAGLVLATAPIIEAQFSQLLANLPTIVDSVRPWVEEWGRRTGTPVRADAVPTELLQRALAWLTGAIGGIIASGLAFFNLISLVVVAPVVAFYLLRDWDIVTDRIATWWPRRYDNTIRQLLAQADEALSGFVRGQFLVCICLAVLYAIGWGAIGLDYFFVLALLAGLLGFVPFVGPFFGVAMSVLVAIGQFGLDPTHIGLVLLVFVVVQIIEGSVLTPNLIGNRIGLHPVWVLFAIFAGGELMGVIGIFLAVPIAAVTGVLARWLLTQYLGSRFYRVEAAPPP